MIGIDLTTENLFFAATFTIAAAVLGLSLINNLRLRNLREQNRQLNEISRESLNLNRETIQENRNLINISQEVNRNNAELIRENAEAQRIIALFVLNYVFGDQRIDEYFLENPPQVIIEPAAGVITLRNTNNQEEN